ncbi:MAG: carbohydrate binding family 9 domain-containing protein [Ignavibacteriae bacterium]|nr:carbohydrate binding family 9 domain-containing protein [Ignavibacteriota bacterium]
MKNNLSHIFISVLFLISTTVFANEPLKPIRVQIAPNIDGVLDEPLWNQAPKVSGFKTFIPDFDIIPKEQTEVMLAYDSANLYFAFKCYDEPDKIKASVSARDKMITDDFICINLDAFNDQQGLNAFYVNAFGIQGDSKFAAGNEDFSPDYVWYSAGKINPDGFTVEVQLPLKSLRYRNDEPTTMGVILERFISRRNEHSCFPRLDPAKGFALLTQMYPLEYSGIEHYTLLEILPALTATRQDVREGTNLVRSKQEAEASLNLKYGITSDLILDGTINPDFSQVESDAGQVDVNLRSRLFNSEKRSFFLEGQDNFNLAVSANSFDPMLFYSRTIIEPVLGTKLTGKVGKYNTLAALYAVDNVLEQERPTLGNYIHVPVLRFKSALSDDSYLGFLYAGRELDESHNRVLGYDEQIRVSESSVLESAGFLTWAKDVGVAKAVRGHTLGFRYSYNTRNLDFSLNAREISENFRADMGYYARTGVVNFIGFVRPKIYPASDLLQRIDFELATGHTKDRFGGLWETGNDLAATVFFAGNWTFRTRAVYATEIFEGQRFKTSGVHTQLRSNITKTLFTNLLFRHTQAIFYPASLQGKSDVVSATVNYQPTENMQVDGSFTYSDFTSEDTQEMLYHYTITRLKLTYQVNQYLFFRALGEYNNFRKQLSTDVLASFTYIPGTVVYVGYGSIFNKVRWDGTSYVESENLLEMRRGLFFKMSYLWRS